MRSCPDTEIDPRLIAPKLLVPFCRLLWREHYFTNVKGLIEFALFTRRRYVRKTLRLQ